MKYEKSWLEYRLSNCEQNKSLFEKIYCENSGEIIETVKKELELAVFNILGKTITWTTDCNIATVILKVDASLANKSGGFNLKKQNNKLTITGYGTNGLLYGVFEVIRLLQKNEEILDLEKEVIPSTKLRMLNHWDNMDGSIERGYSGNSFFFENEEIIINERTIEYARLVASVGINSVVINNVNVKGNATKLISLEYREKVKEMALIFANYGIKLYLSLNFAAPIESGELDSADPCNELVKLWWKNTMDNLYKDIPMLGGFLVKADSEGRPGPFTYNRNHADGANMLAECVKKYDGIIIWRCFVYNCQQDWRDKKTDRARAGYDNFKPLDGMFDKNVILQIKNGPMDFQVREPISPLFGGLEKTNQILEVQIAQEYTGQQKHVCYLIPMFKEILAFKTYNGQEKDTVKDIIKGNSIPQAYSGIAAVANTGNDENWTGHDLAAANLYGFGRLSFNMELSAEEIAKEWIIGTFGTDELIEKQIEDILMNSWKVYEKYTAPLGIGWMVNPEHHYGPNVDGYEYDRWGTYHRADHKGMGVERGEEGTNYIGQYQKVNADMFANIETCPEELLLFFHYIPYNYRLKSGKTLIQHIYDSHFEGVDDVEEMIKKWNSLEGKIDKKIFERVGKRFNHQFENAKEWRDRINTYFWRKSGIDDEKSRTIY